MSKGMIDNKQRGLVGDVLKKHMQKGSKLSVAAAHFTLYAFVELKKEFSQIEELRFIFTEPAFVRGDHLANEKIAKNETLLYGVEEEQKYKAELNQAYIAKEFAKWLKQKAKIKSVTTRKIEGGLYHVQNKDGTQIGLVGGAPFSSPGLGYSNSSNMYINTITDDEKENIELLRQFDDIWKNEYALQDVKEQILRQLEVLYQEHTPEFIYFVTLYNLFKDFLQETRDYSTLQTKTGFEKTTIWNKLYDFQRDGVVGAINKIETYGGCIIADSVGLGKTFEALAIIKYYELRNHRVLVLAPKKLRENWEIYRANDKRNVLLEDRFSYDLLNHTDLSRKGGYSGNINLEYVNWGNYDLVVIDESHNFRNNDPRKSHITRYSRLMNDIIKAGVKTKVLMLSATPVNNKLDDLKNQIAFITEGNDKALAETANIKSINQTIRRAQSQFKKWSNLPEEERTTERLLDMLSWDYFTLLDSLTIARSRRHIEKYYNVDAIGKFPQRLKPINIKETIDAKQEFPSLSIINNDILRLRFALYSPMKYILPHKQAFYHEKYDTKVANGHVLKQTDRENNLVYLMKTNLLKRLESSIYSFSLTLKNIIEQIDAQLSKIEIEATNIGEFAEIDMEDDELEEAFVGAKVKIALRDIDRIRWKQDLLYDRTILQKLLDYASQVTPERDQKMLTLKKMIQQKIAHPINGQNKKILIFTAFADTAKYLYEHLHRWIRHEFHLHCAVVTGKDRPKTTFPMQKTDFNNVLMHFSPTSKERKKLMPDMTDEIDILIATDCISEGQNLQDCDYLINYDIHWNPVRIIQRFGRIDRIGSKNEQIQLVNFWPPMELDEYINLVGRVKDRMAILDISSTGEEDVLSSNSNEMKDLEYRRKQLEKLQSEVIDLEDISGNISLTDFTMDDFRMDLLNFMKQNKEMIETAPFGLFSITVNKNEKLRDDIQPGVIFCLKQINHFTTTHEQNALHPYYLVYVKENGEVLYNHIHVKKILDLYRSLCHGKNEVESQLYAAFYEETKNGKEMGVYKQLLEQAVEEIVGKIDQHATLNIFSLGNLDQLMTTANTNLQDFEIVSYLIIKG
ncbi:helicase-related protein [Anoxybacillus flavithermus]|uniref:helicase-related protein n=1 Tax=Anoxybacillus flavithermus TaxID=33934 RepID=UPI0018677C27|nr:helicase-related protein [Anoxybacillus flavithermus]MBE2906709.1 helicase [Anoxybacillus flavithermus]MBE2910040.1 helicase [Anoxybacillus flavithermus]MBE2915590.1 helicase [Anoxybacillus flavithermus]